MSTPHVAAKPAAPAPAFIPKATASPAVPKTATPPAPPVPFAGRPDAPTTLPPMQPVGPAPLLFPVKDRPAPTIREIRGAEEPESSLRPAAETQVVPPPAVAPAPVTPVAPPVPAPTTSTAEPPIAAPKETTAVTNEARLAAALDLHLQQLRALNARVADLEGKAAAGGVAPASATVAAPPVMDMTGGFLSPRGSTPVPVSGTRISTAPWSPPVVVPHTPYP